MWIAPKQSERVKDGDKMHELSTLTSSSMLSRDSKVATNFVIPISTMSDP